MSNDRIAMVRSIEDAPFSRVLGIRIESPAEGVARVTLPFDERFLNAGGVEMPIHGGTIASIIDIAACAAVWSLPATNNSATISMTVNYASPGIKSDLTAEAR